MDPVGSWPVYAYNRGLTGVQTGTDHPVSTTTGPASAATAATFLPPPAVHYESVFSPIFHKAAHYRPPKTEPQFVSQPNASFFDTHNWQQNGPFGILPHESVANRSSPPAQSNKHANYAPDENVVQKNCAVPMASRVPHFKSQQQAPLQHVPLINKLQNKIFEGQHANSPSNATPAAVTAVVNQSKRNATFSHGGVNYNIVAGRHYEPVPDFQKSQPNTAADYSGSPCGSPAELVVPRRPSPATYSPHMYHGHPAAMAVAVAAAAAASASPSSNTNAAQNSGTSISVPLDVSVPRIFPTVIARTDKVGSAVSATISTNNPPTTTYPSTSSCSWDQRKFAASVSLTPTTHNNHCNSSNSPIPNTPMALSLNNSAGGGGGSTTSAETYFASSSDALSLVKSLQVQQQNRLKKPKIEPAKPVPIADRMVVNDRVPPPAHNGTIYFDLDQRWVPNTATPKYHNSPQQTTHHQHSPHHHQQQQHPQQNLPQQSFPTQYFANSPTPQNVAHSPQYMTSQSPPNQHHFQSQTQQGIQIAPQITAQTIVHPNPQTFEYMTTSSSDLIHVQENTTIVMGAHHNKAVEEEEAADQPKVVVPDIEEELNFLSSEPVSVKRSDSAKQKKTPPEAAAAVMCKSVTTPEKISLSSGKAGFMDSFIKFLHGDKESSPPPKSAIRKQHSWTKSTNNAPTTSTNATTQSSSTSETPTGESSINIPQVKPLSQPIKRTCDPQDDPRYFPLPKESDRISFSSSSDDEALPKRDKTKQPKTPLGSTALKSINKNPTNTNHPVSTTEPGQTCAPKKSTTKLNDPKVVKAVNDKQPQHQEKKASKNVGKPTSQVRVKVVGGGGGTNILNSKKRGRPLKESKASDSGSGGESNSHANNVNDDDESILKRKKERKPSLPKEKSDEEVPLRRESVKRAAKERNQNNSSNIYRAHDLEDLDEPPEFQDSDSDPAWTPKAKDDDEEPTSGISKKNRRSKIKGRRKPNLLMTTAQEVTTDHSNVGEHYPAVSKATDYTNNEAPATAQANSNLTPVHSEPNTVATSSFGLLPAFKTGDFVLLKSDLPLLISSCPPMIWRIDNCSLLQKFELTESQGKSMYKNLTTYAAWAENKREYVGVPVRILMQTGKECLVEVLRMDLIRSIPIWVAADYHRKSMQKWEQYRDNFEVYIQTLISQALDSNFLTEIFQEKDEYFLTNVKTVDNITEEKKNEILDLVRWPDHLQAAVCTWPCYNVFQQSSENGQVPLTDLCLETATMSIHPPYLQSGQSGNSTCQKTCLTCRKQDCFIVKVLLYGQPYNSNTLEGCQPDPKAINDKNFHMCRICASRVEIVNKVVHQKYLMYIECALRVSEKRVGDPNKNTTTILNELLADEDWLNRLFIRVRTAWADVDTMRHVLLNVAV